MAEVTTPNPLLNRLLALLPANTYRSLYIDLEFMPLHFGAEIYGAGESQEFVYFPTTAVISLLSTVESGRSAEIGIVGSDGIVGITHSWAAAAQRIEPWFKVQVVHSVCDQVQWCRCLNGLEFSNESC